MNDEQLLRRLAEAEGLVVHERGYVPHTLSTGTVMEEDGWGLFVEDPLLKPHWDNYFLFNPLANTEQTFALIEKYDMTVNRVINMHGDFWECRCHGKNSEGGSFVAGIDHDLKRAATLAIIQAEKE